MAGIEFTYNNVFMFVSAILPFLLVFFMFMLSVFDYNLKGFIYLAGLFLCYVITIPLQNVMNIRLIENPNFTNNVSTNNNFNMARNSNPQSPLCYLFNFRENALFSGLLSVPSFNSVIIAYTLVYILLPMISNNSINYAFIFCMVIFLIMDAYSRVKNFCTNPAGVVFGILLGAIIGTIYFVIIKSSGNGVLLYNDDFVSNKVACSRPSEQQFKCAVYRNGELLRNLN